MPVYNYEIQYRNNADDPSQTFGPSSSNREAMTLKAEPVHQKAKGITAVRLVRRDRETGEGEVTQVWPATACPND